MFRKYGRKITTDVWKGYVRPVIIGLYDHFGKVTVNIIIGLTGTAVLATVADATNTGPVQISEAVTEVVETYQAANEIKVRPDEDLNRFGEPIVYLDTLRRDVSGTWWEIVQYTGISLDAAVSVDVGGDSIGGTVINIETLIITAAQATKIVFTDCSIHEQAVHDNVADGISLGNGGGVTSDVIVASNSANRTWSIGPNVASDKIIIEAPTADGFIKTLDLTNIVTRGSWTLHDFVAGRVEVQTSTVGVGDGILAQDLVIDVTCDVGNAPVGENANNLQIPTTVL